MSSEKKYFVFTIDELDHLVGVYWFARRCDADKEAEDRKRQNPNNAGKIFVGELLK